MSKLALWAQTVAIAYLPLRQDLLAKNVLMTAQRDLCLGNSLFTFDIFCAQRFLLKRSPPPGEHSGIIEKAVMMFS